MDFELINYWIHNLELSINHTTGHNPRLFLHLQAHSNDISNSHVICLSQDKDDILVSMQVLTMITSQ